MKLLFRKFKSSLIILLLIFLLSYVTINYVHLKRTLKEDLTKLAVLEQKQQQQPQVQIPIDEKIDNPAKNDEPKEMPLEKEKVIDIDTKQPEKDSLQQPDPDDYSKRKRFYAIDGNGRGSVNKEVIKCSEELEVEVTDTDLEKADFTYFLDSVPSRSNIDAINKNKKRHYYMVYGMESEPHSGGGESWRNADFYMWYNLDASFPEPATYFDVKSYLPDLLSPPRVEFENKEKSADLVWVLSNCNAHNSREKYVKRLMELISVDSYGFCLRNKDTHTSQRMSGNVELFAKYKFVIAIENSNCEDYITEKLVHAVASGSIPIVAGRDNKPNYARYMPKNSYINIYDFKSVEELAQHLKKVASSKDEYEKYIHFKRKHNYTREYLHKLTLNEKLDLAKTILDYENEKEFFNGILLKEKSENKLCKVARYLKTTPRNVIEEQIKKKSRPRPSVGEACLSHGVFVQDFKLN